MSILVFASLASACALLANVDGLVGAAPVATDATQSSDAPLGETSPVELEAAPSPEAAAPEAASDATDGDTSTVTVDAGPWCAQHDAALCDDFDTTALAARWDTFEETAGPLVLDGDASVSAPRSLVATGGPAAGFGSRSRLAKQFAPAQRIRLAADIRIDARDGTSSADFLALTLFPPPAGYEFFGVSVGMVAGAIQLERCEHLSAGSPACSSTSLPVVLDQFHRLALDFDVAGGTVKVFIDGVEATTRSVTAVPSPLGQEAAVGITWNNAVTGAWRVRVDNVLVTLN